jgi:hypothetical protein
MIKELIDEIQDIIVSCIVAAVVIGALLWFLGGQGFFAMFAPLLIMAGIPVDPFWMKILMVCLPPLFIFSVKFASEHIYDGKVVATLCVSTICAVFLLNIWFVWGFFAYPHMEQWYEREMTTEQKIQYIEARMEDTFNTDMNEWQQKLDYQKSQLRSNQ